MKSEGIVFLISVTNDILFPIKHHKIQYPFGQSTKKKRHTFSKPHFCYCCAFLISACVQAAVELLQLHPHTKVKQSSILKVNYFIGQTYRWKRYKLSGRQFLENLSNLVCAPHPTNLPYKPLLHLLHLASPSVSILNYHLSILWEYKCKVILTAKRTVTYKNLTFRNAPCCFRYFLFQDTPFFSNSFCPNWSTGICLDSSYR